jgi:HTH-type transcriptional regulator/antitoxin HipB
MGSNNQLQLHSQTLQSLAQHLRRERVSQDLSREQLAAVCNVSPSFIRDAESYPGRCSLELMLKLVQGLGLKVSISGWGPEVPGDAQSGEPVLGPSA